ncbi:MAG TPA: pyridoxal phosphate-dependent aminotransferase [Gemmatimonas aurantiaca]|uniref:Aminotransferase n=2 Tax=Gemmatimonas aurantiaca TaxID=173480 RepID=C1A6F2_GEMAT|nr:pyridoxal phosphate-dependent aminotransferase [Gemmatimonas aurantiaca]BAH37812.1 aspartate aminotransferase [Gemmatimonas aurantiaca T-27]HCT56590.1 pyridoxal phosphate-dependent aminotransferase [Gemmatimonas aurantiaca]
MSLLFQPSPNIIRLKESATLAVAAKARALKAAGKAVIDLGAGEPDFDTPAFIREAAAEAMVAGHTRYTATEGVLPLREAIAADANRIQVQGTPVTPAEVVVSNGSKQSLYNACVCCFGPGDEVLVPTPSWTSYYEMIELARAVSVPVFGDAANSLKVTAEQLAAAATPRTKGLMLNSPSNPTGAVYSREELSAIFTLAAERGWWVIADEIYLRIAYEGGAQSALEVAPTRDNLIIINGVAKAYAMTGWRIGWSIAPVALSKAMNAFQSHTTSNASSISQYAAVAAIARREEADVAVNAMVQSFRERRDAVVTALSAFPSVRYVHPAGAFYVYINVEGFRGAADPGAAFAAAVLDEYGVAVVPGGAFLTPGWVRASYATTQSVAVDGVTRIAQCLTA